MLPDVFGEKLFDTFFGNSPFAMLNAVNGNGHVMGKSATGVMKTDVLELENDYRLDIDLPGYKKEEVRLELEGGYLTISAAKVHETEEKAPKGQYLRRERFAGSCSRSFYVGEDLEPKDVAAKFENGILSLTFPKNPAPKTPENKLITIA